jgi:cytidyltransferase-like protein
VPERIGVFGGTFDPPHVGHLVTAVNVRHALGLDRVLLVVANVPWQKEGQRDISSGEDRFALVQAAVGPVQGLEASRIELDHGGLADAVGTVGRAKIERAHAVDHRQYAAAQRGQAGDVRSRAWHGDQSIELDYRFDRIGWKSDTFTGDSDDEEQFVHRLPLPADFNATSNAARS